MVFLVGIIVLGTIAYHFNKNQNSLIYSKVELNAMTYAEHMRLDIMQGINVTNTLEQILVNNDGNINKFPEIAESMMADYIQSIQIAPGGKVTEIYPAAGNEAGKIDLLNDKDRGEISRYGRDHDIITMQGPFELKQGGSGIAVRNPVFMERDNGQKEFWGFTIVMIRVPDIFSESIRALSDFGYDYALFKTSAPWDDTYNEVYGSGTDMEKAVSFDFEVGDTDWLLKVQPKGGWDRSHNLHLMFACGVLILLLVSGLIAVITLLRRTRETESRTAELNSKLQEALDLSNAASVAKTEFIHNMSHDIRTPMNAIIGYTAIALKNDPAENVKKYLDKISESSKQLMTLINDVLNISRVEGGKLSLTLAETDIRTVVDEVLDITRGSMARRDLELVVIREPISAPYVLADSMMIRSILVNILSNAVKFTRDGGTITFTAKCANEEDDKHVIVNYVISDTGIGMADEFLKHIFEEFTQENTDARTHYKGTGLGMTIVKHYVDMMNGTISIESKKNVGTTVSISLPLEITSKPDHDEDDVYVYSSLNGLNVLLAEDNDLNAEIARILLEEQGMNVTRAVNGRQAADIFKERSAGAFDLILMDIMMPEMNGYEAAEAIRNMEGRPDGKTIPIIAMTANAFPEDIQRSLDAGMNGHMSKPISIDRLLKVILKNIKNIDN